MFKLILTKFYIILIVLLFSCQEPQIIHNEILSVKNPQTSMVKIDKLLIPTDEKGQHFKNFINFYDFISQNKDYIESLAKKIKETIDKLGLAKDGYRLVIEENKRPFDIRIFGGEELGNTVQLASGASKSHGAGIDHLAPYDISNPFMGYIKSCLKEKRNCIEISNNNEKALVFDDTKPQADIHRLIIPKKPYVSSYQFFDHANKDELLAIFKAMNEVILENKLLGYDFRFISNAGKIANQRIGHVHFHAIRGGPKFGPLAKNPVIPKV